MKLSTTLGLALAASLALSAVPAFAEMQPIPNPPEKPAPAKHHVKKHHVKKHHVVKKTTETSAPAKPADAAAAAPKK